VTWLGTDALRSRAPDGSSAGGSSERIGSTRARHQPLVAGSTVTGVVYGVIGTAIAQGLLAGLGF
jgi:hypothetical protein